MGAAMSRTMFALSLWAALSGSAAAQGVPVVDPAALRQNVIINQHMQTDLDLQRQQAERRARLDEIRAEQIEVLDGILEATRNAAGAGTGQMVAGLEAGEGGAASASSVYPQTDSNFGARQMFGDARANIEQIIIQGARDTQHLPGVQKAGLSPIQWRALLQALIWQESRFNPTAGSHAGAYGLTQIMEGTAKDLGIFPAFRTNPLLQVQGGGRYLAQRLNDFNGNIVFALAAYNAGIGNVRKYGGVPPFKETQHYVQVIPRKYNEYLARIGGVDALGTIEPGLLANAQLGYAGMMASGYGDDAMSNIALAATRIRSIIDRIEQTPDAAEAMALNSYARAELARIMAARTRLAAMNAQPNSAAHVAQAAVMAEEMDFIRFDTIGDAP